MLCATMREYILFVIVLFNIYGGKAQQNDYDVDLDYLDMDPDSLLAESARITANATCGQMTREHYCRLVEHAGYDEYKRTKRQVYEYSKPQTQDARTFKDVDGSLVECNFCDARDRQLKHPIEYAVSGDSDSWWQSPSLAEGLRYHAVTIDIDLKQVYQIVFVLLRMGDSPRPANWILEKSIDGFIFEPWVFFSESAEMCRKLYQPMINSTLQITSDSRPNQLRNDEVYCTTYFSQPQNLQAGEIIVPLTMDREGSIKSYYETNQPVDPDLIEFLSARFVRLKFQKLQTLSGDWMTLPDLLDPSVYNRYYYSIRNIKVGGKCICNSHANQCDRKIINGVPRAVCECKHNTCGHTCERCCPLFNQQPWRPGGLCEACNCHGKADSCVYNQTVANLQLSLNQYRVREGGGVCINCREQTTGVNCEDCIPGYYRPMDVGPDAKNPCVSCNCNIHGSTGFCVSNDALMPHKQPGDCICRPGFEGRRCERCAEGFYQSLTNPTECVACPCDLSGSQPGDGYRCQPPCNCKANVDHESLCRTCLPEHFNLDQTNAEGCQSCFCMGLSKDCKSVSVPTARRLEMEGRLGTVATMRGWELLVPGSASKRTLPITPITLGDNSHSNQLRILQSEVEFGLGPSASVSGQAYYWSAPKDYLGKQLTAYHGKLEMISRFGSPSGRTGVTGSRVQGEYSLSQVWIDEPDLIFEGHGIRLAHSVPSNDKSVHRVIRVDIYESAFRVLVEANAESLDRIPIRQTQAQEAPQHTYRDPTARDRYGSVNFVTAGRPATIVDIMTVLSNLSHIYVKAKYTDDQSYIELRRVALERAERANITNGVQKGVLNIEECKCPPGHTGTSCEDCMEGYWRDPKITPLDQTNAVDAFFSLVNPIYKRACVACECNGRSNKCDANTGHCLECDFNTFGPNCNECAPGFHMDLNQLGSNVCQPCECPILTNQKTNFCVAFTPEDLTFPKHYACIDCNDNTRGQFCEKCIDFYYGNPLLEQPCRPCDCGAAATGCDEVTGECKCGFNTAGPRCTVCESGSHGDPSLGKPCNACGCHPKGSLSVECDRNTGLCSCQMFYEGKHCDRCVSGRGNVEAGCPFCACDPLGSIPQANASCDPVTGQCVCKPGVGGSRECDRCDDGFYNMGSNGCQECECSNRALKTACHAETGQCFCGENVVGKKCDRCLPGHYWNGSEPHCLDCNCGPGATGSECDPTTGQCRCAPYVTGRACDLCEAGFWGASPTGCQRCPRCPNGLVCDQLDGKCICPVNTEGDQCETCSKNSWDHNPVIGCKNCDCSDIGSVDPSQGCDLVTGQCGCKHGFAGRACDECQAGYYDYPNCQPCMCNLGGSVRNTTIGLDSLTCNPITGACHCKPNVRGEKCDECRPGSFGLDPDYPLGCYACFCFPTSNDATCAQLTGYRSVPGPEHKLQLVSTDNQYLPGGPLVDLELSLQASSGSTDLPDLTQGQNQFKWRFSTNVPTFLKLPNLSGSHTRSYGSIFVELHSDCLPSGKCGIVEENGYDLQATQAVPDRTVREDPQMIHAQMTALNGQLEFEYQPVTPPPRTPVASGDLGAEYYPIWMKESEWVLTRIQTQSIRVRPSRAALMLALTNITSFNVRLFMPQANPKFVSVNYRIRNAVSESLTQLGTSITTIETCTCANNANGDHCEIPYDLSFFPPIIIKPRPDGNYFDDLVDPSRPMPSVNGSTSAGGTPSFDYDGGSVRICECHGKAVACDKDTGSCLSCKDHTAGSSCEVCEQGYYGDPIKGIPCVKCRCPTEATDYAKSCHPIDPLRPSSQFVCDCMPGFVGNTCDRCDSGYYGDPLMMIPCTPCNCNPEGSRNQHCNMKTGQCTCLPGIIGRRCDECPKGFVVEGGRCIDCRGECTGELLQRADTVELEIDNQDINELANQGLDHLEKRAEALKSRYSMPTIQREGVLIEQASKLTSDLSRIVLLTFSSLPHNAARLDNTSCVQSNATAQLSRDTVALGRRLDDWLTGMQSLRPGPVDEETSKMWHESARMIRQVISRIDLSPTKEWADELLKISRPLETQLKAIENRMKNSNFGPQIDRLQHYQDEQGAHLDGQEQQLYQMANATLDGLRNIKEAQERMKNIQDIMNTAEGGSLDKLRENQTNLAANITRLKQIVVNYETSTIPKLDKLTNDLEQAQLFEQIPNSIPPDVIFKADNLERTLNDIVTALDVPGVEKAIEGREAYKMIADTLLKARNVTDEAMMNVDEAKTNESVDSLLNAVKKRHSSLSDRVKQLGDGVVSENLVVRNNDERLQNLDSSFKGILQVLQRTLSASDLTNQMSEKLKPLVASTKPEMEFLTSEVAEERRRLDILEEEVRSVEKRYNEMEGTANLAINQANSTQQSLINAIEKTEQRFYDLEKKMTSTRHLSALARSLLDLTYASLGKDPIPLRMKGAGCVYTLIPYHLTKSRVFDLELWFTPGLDRVASVGSAASQRVRGDVVILAGRRAFPGRTVMFALTVEETGLLRFSWSQPESSEGFKFLELGPVNATTTSRIRVNAISGKVSFYVQEIPEGVDTLDYLPVQKVAYTDEQSLITSHLMVDNQLEIRVGGPFHSTVIGGPLMESWGENGAEELWTRLQKMGNAYGCLFNLKVSGHMMGFQDFAKADTSCTQQTNDVCKIHTNFRPLIRNGLVWQKQPPLEAGLEPHPRPAMKERRDPRLEYMALHDFAAEDSYVRISDFAELNVCDKTLDVQLQKLSPNQADSMVLTFYNYREDYGITLESKNNELVATRWQGDLMQPRTSSTVIGKMQNFPKTSMFTNYWTLGKPFATDCAVAKQDELVIYLGGLPPGHFELRKRMKELGLTTTGFRGRIGLKNSFDSIPAALYADYFTKKPIKNYCDSRFSDIWQSGESFGVPNANPSGQYCLTLVPSPDYTIFELDPRLFRAPWTPEISMTVRFHPIGIGEISLLRMQFKDSQWLRIWLTPDLRVGLGIPEPYVSMKLITTEIFGTPMIQDPTNSLAALKAREAHVFNQSLFTEAILTIRFGDKDSKTLTVLFDQRPVQTWTLKKAIPETDILQVLVGPEFHPKLVQNHQELSINNLVIGQRRVDFETDMRSVSRGRSSHRFGECGSQLRPRFVPQDNKVQANLLYQGLDLPTPPVGRRLRSIFEHCEENGNVCDSVNENVTTEWPSIIHSLLSPKPSRRVRVRSSSGGNEIINKNCMQEQKSSAWFDGKSASYWNVNGVQNTLVNAGVKMFRLEIGFRLQPVREETNTVAVLAAFEFVSDQENLFVVTSGDRIHLIHKSSSYFGKTFSWTSPILDLQESAWHRLELISDEDGRVQFIFDSYEIWIEEGIAWGVPTAAYIGGYPLSQSLQLPRTSVPVPIQSLFGCVDELALGGRRFDVAKSKRPVCPTCFVINANAVHIPATVRDVIQPERGILLPMNFPVNKRVNQPMEKIKFDFEVLYNPEKVGIESLFVLVFQERNNEDPVRLWVYLDRFKLVVTDMSTDARISFGVSKAEPNAWHFASISIESDAGMSVVTVSKQGESGVLVIFSTIGDLLSIFYAYDDVITPKAESEKHYGVAVPPFTGCLRKLQISIDGSKSVAVSFPPNSPSLIYGVCPL